MYKKSVQGCQEHLDFIILGVVCLGISFTRAFGMWYAPLDVFANSLYRDMMWSLALVNIVVIFSLDSLKNVLKGNRGISAILNEQMKIIIRDKD